MDEPILTKPGQTPSEVDLTDAGVPPPLTDAGVPPPAQPADMATTLEAGVPGGESTAPPVASNPSSVQMINDKGAAIDVPFEDVPSRTRDGFIPVDAVTAAHINSFPAAMQQQAHDEPWSAGALSSVGNSIPFGRTLVAKLKGLPLNEQQLIAEENPRATAIGGGLGSLEQGGVLAAAPLSQLGSAALMGGLGGITSKTNDDDVHNIPHNVGDVLLNGVEGAGLNLIGTGAIGLMGRGVGGAGELSGNAISSASNAAWNRAAALQNKGRAAVDTLYQAQRDALVLERQGVQNKLQSLQKAAADAAEAAPRDLIRGISKGELLSPAENAEFAKIHNSPDFMDWGNGIRDNRGYTHISTVVGDPIYGKQVAIAAFPPGTDFAPGSATGSLLLKDYPGDPKKMYADTVMVSPPSERNRGLATNMYKYAENVTGKTMVASPEYMSQDALNLWAKNDKENNFGVYRPAAPSAPLPGGMTPRQFAVTTGTLDNRIQMLSRRITRVNNEWAEKAKAADVTNPGLTNLAQIAGAASKKVSAVSQGVDEALNSKAVPVALQGSPESPEQKVQEIKSHIPGVSSNETAPLDNSTATENDLGNVNYNAEALAFHHGLGPLIGIGGDSKFKLDEDQDTVGAHAADKFSLIRTAAGKAARHVTKSVKALMEDEQPDHEDVEPDENHADSSMDEHKTLLSQSIDPEREINTVADNIADIGQNAPAHGGALGALAIRARQVLQSVTPQNPAPSMFQDDQWKPSEADLFNYDQVKSAVLDPKSVFVGAADGSLSDMQWKAFANVYPNIAADYSQELIKHAATTKVPQSLNQKRVFGLVTGIIPTELQPDNVAFLQSSYTSPILPPQGPAPKKTPASVNLNEASLTATPTEAAGITK